MNIVLPYSLKFHFSDFLDVNVFHLAVNIDYPIIQVKKTSYSEDSKIETEFDITRYLKPGKNLIAFQVFRWCDGTYMEDQDYFRLCGVSRDCWLYARDRKCRVEDVRLTPELYADYSCGKLNVDMTFPKSAKGSKVAVTLKNADGKEIARQSECTWTYRTRQLRTYNSDSGHPRSYLYD